MNDVSSNPPVSAVYNVELMLEKQLFAAYRILVGRASDARDTLLLEDNENTFLCE